MRRIRNYIAFPFLVLGYIFGVIGGLFMMVHDMIESGEVVDVSRDDNGDD